MQEFSVKEISQILSGILKKRYHRYQSRIQAAIYILH